MYEDFLYDRQRPKQFYFRKSVDLLFSLLKAVSLSRSGKAHERRKAMDI